MERNLPTKRLWRAALLATTGLSAFGLAPARAQTLAPNTTPQGGQVAAGAATITQGNASTTIDQSSQRTVINWQSFNVGSGAQVQFNQPSSSAIALNRVMTPSPSLIAGRISANGQLVIINQSGVVFAKGSEVNAESLVVATSDIKDKDFMAGRMVFSGAPGPGSKILNDGNITVKDTGLVGLVAPQVENDGVITAKLGAVVLAGASAFTLDLYGDRLISIDVTQAVRAVDVGGKILPALVTNRGLILADGGKITLTAQDADALVTQLVDAGGTIRADSVGAQAGAINISGVGGDISIAGNLLARGGAGAKGGSVQILSTGTVSMAPEAVVDVSGAAGGGVVALGTDLTRAAQGPSDTAAPRAAAVVAAAGARIAADATQSGNGGRVTVLSSKETGVAGDISATGGVKSGNGGFVEVSGGKGYALTGSVSVAAPKGAAGSILIDPQTLLIQAPGLSTLSSDGAGGGTLGAGDDGAEASIDASEFENLTGNVELAASQELDIDEPVTSSTLESLLLTAPVIYSQSNGEISLTGTNARLSLVADNLNLNANVAAPVIELTPFTSGGELDVSAYESDYIQAAGLLRLGAYTPYAPASSATPALMTTAGDIDIEDLQEDDGIAAPVVELDSTGAITQGPGGVPINAGTLVIGAATQVSLLGSTNQISNLDSETTTEGLAITDASDLNILNPVRDGVSIDLVADSVTDSSTLSAPDIALEATGAAGGGTIGINGGDSVIATSGATLNAAGEIYLNGGTLAAPVVSLTSGGVALDGVLDAPSLLAFGDNGAVVQTGGSLTAGELLTTGEISGGLSLAAGSNHIGTLNAAADGVINILDLNTVAIQGSLSGADVLLAAPDIRLVGPGQSIVSESGGTVALGTNGFQISPLSGIQAPGGTIEIAPYTSGALGVTQQLVTGLNPVAAEIIFGNGAAGTQASSVLINSSVSFSGSTLIDLSASSQIVQAAGTLSAATLEFDGGAFIQGSSAAIDTAQLQGDGGAISGNVLLTGTANAIGALGALDIGGNTLQLNDNAGLTVDGALTAGAIALSAADIDLTAPITTGPLVLTSGGDINQGGGAITAGTLSGSAADDAVFTAAGNAIGTLGNFLLPDAPGSGGQFELDDAAALALPGHVTGNNGEISAPIISLTGSAAFYGDLTLQAEQNIGLSGPVTAGGALALITPGAVSGAAAITAGTLTSDGDSDGEVALTGANSIAALADFYAANNFSLDDAVALAISGTGVSAAQNLILTAPALTLNAPLAAGGSLSLLADALTFGGDGPVSGATIALAPYTTGKTLDFGGTLGGDADVAPNGLTSFSAAELDIGSADGRLAANVITAGDLNFSGAVVIDAGHGVTQTGTLAAAAISVFAPSLALGGDVDAAGAFAFTGSGALADTGTLSAGVIDFAAASFIQGSGAGPISAGLLGGSASGAISLGNLANNISEISGLTAGGALLVDDGMALEVSAPVSASAITLDDAGAGIALDSGASLAAPGGTIALIADALSAASGASLTGATAIITPYSDPAIDLGGTSPGTLNLGQDVFSAAAGLPYLQVGNGIAAIRTDAPIVAIAGTLLLDGDGILFNSELAESGALALESAADVSETSAGLITAGTLLGVGDFSNVLLTNQGNQAGGIGYFSFANGGTLAYDTAETLTLAGLFSASNLTFAAGAILVPGTITAPDELLLAAGSSIGISGTITAGALDLALASGQVSETSGAVVTAATLAGAPEFQGSLLFTGAHNNIGTLAGISADTLLLTDTGLLTIAGPVSAANASMSAGTIAVNGPLDVSGGLVLNSTAGGIAGLGAITAATLSDGGILSVGNVALTGTANAVGTLGGFALQTGRFALNDTLPLEIYGPLNALSGSIAAPGLAINGAVDIGTQLTLISSGAITEAGVGGITAPTLSGSATGDADFSNINDIGTLAGISTGGALTLLDSGALGIAGSNTAASASLTTPTLSLTGSLLVSDELQLTTGAGVLEGANGELQAATLTGSNASGNVMLASPVNSIVTLGAFGFGGGTFSLADAQALDVTGAVTGGSAELSAPAMTLGPDAGITTTAGVTLDGQNAYGSSLVIDGLITAADLSLQNFAGIIEPSGTIMAGAIDGGGGSDGNVLLGDGGTTPVTNQIGTLGQLNATGLLQLTDADALVVAGSVAAGQILLQADGIDFAGNVSSADELDISSPGPVTQSGGTISAKALFSDDDNANGDTALNDSGNDIQTLGGYQVTPGGTLSLVDASPLDVTGSLTAGAVNLAADGITLDSGITSGNLTLTSAAGITQNTGALVTGVLSGTAAGDTVLALAGNSIATVANFTDAGNFTLDDSTGLGITGKLSASVLGLAGSGDLAETGAGQITASFLTANTGGAAKLASALNQIGTLGNFSSGGDLTLDDAEPLDITGAITPDGGAGMFSLTDSGGVTQTGGNIDAALLTGGAGGAALFTRPGNAIGDLGDFAATGDITLVDSTPLDLTGNVSNPGQALSLTDTGGDILQASGAVTTGVLNAAAADIYLGDANDIATIGDVIVPGNVVLVGANGLVGTLAAQGAFISGNGDFGLVGISRIGQSLTITATGALTQTTDISVPNLTLAGAGINLAANDQVSGLLELISSAGLAQERGDINAEQLEISAAAQLTQDAGATMTAPDAVITAGSIALAGTDVFANSLALFANGDVTQNGGYLAVGTLTGTALDLADFGQDGAAAYIGTLGNYILDGDNSFVLNDAQSLVITGSVVANIISITTPGELSLLGGGGLYDVAGGVNPNYSATLGTLATSSYTALSASSIIETGGFAFNQPVSGNTLTASYGTVFMITDGGDITFGGQLSGTDIDLVIAAGSTGKVTGMVNVHHLEVIDAGNTDLTGVIDGYSGQEAAGKASALPVPQNKYQINSCPIGSVNCIILSNESVPTANPLENFDISQHKRRRLNKNVQLPGVATHDF